MAASLDVFNTLRLLIVMKIDQKSEREYYSVSFGRFLIYDDFDPLNNPKYSNDEERMQYVELMRIIWPWMAEKE